MLMFVTRPGRAALFAVVDDDLMMMLQAQALTVCELPLKTMRCRERRLTKVGTLLAGEWYEYKWAQTQIDTWHTYAYENI
jgi:hypothetical protein